MLNSSDDNNNGRRLFGSEDGVSNDNVPAGNANSVFSNASADAEPPKDHGHSSLFASTFSNDSATDDDNVQSSFAIQFKANDPDSVSDKLKSAP